MPRHLRHPDGYTLVEIMLTVGIFAVIGMLSLSLIRNIAGQGNAADYKRRVQQAAALIQGAYSRYRQDHSPTASTSSWDLTPYMDYVSVDTTTAIDDVYGSTSYGCDSGGSHPCILLKNGARMVLPMSSFGNTASTNCIYMGVDPDGTYGGTTNGLGKAVGLYLYYNGQLLDEDHAKPHSYSNWWPDFGPGSGSNPPYFSWN